VSTITPHILVRDAARAADWYARALGAEVGKRIRVPDGRYMQIELRLGDSQVMIADEFPRDGCRLTADARRHLRRADRRFCSARLRNRSVGVSQLRETSRRVRSSG
jgi:uncharacterized glyoxalase superfamily protein PhnB